MGEGFSNDEQLMLYITSANIACGYHAGNHDIMKRTVDLCVKHNVAIGAHPGYGDKENFGRVEHVLSQQEYYDLILKQLTDLKKITDALNTKIHHIKPHGALYNQAAKDKNIAASIAKAVKDFDSDLILHGLSGSYSISEAKKINLKTASEVFADRTYTDEGSLTSRKEKNALIVDEALSIKQVLQMVKDKTVTSINNKTISIAAETICIHGDNEHAVEFAKRIHQTLKQNNIGIKAC
jgi:UPF0271 protein